MSREDELASSEGTTGLRTNSHDCFLMKIMFISLHEVLNGRIIPFTPVMRQLEDM